MYVYKYYLLFMKVLDTQTDTKRKGRETVRERTYVHNGGICISFSWQCSEFHIMQHMCSMSS